VAHLEDQLSGHNVRTRPMFGEYGIYCDEKVVGLICDDTLFLKPSTADPALFARTDPAPPYPGAKDYHRVPGEAVDDREWLGRAVQATADALPPPKAPRARELPHHTGGIRPHPRRPRQ
jgi:TfoX/Sxy family transcriptional regulator of competence genes